MVRDDLIDLANTMLAQAGEQVVYRRRIHRVTISAVPGRRRRGIVIDSEMQMATDELDWLIRPESLVLDGRRVLPEDGDEIERTTVAGVVVYVVRPLIGDACYEPDAMNTSLRVRTKMRGPT